VLAKVPVHAQAEVKAAYWQIFDNIELPAGQAAVEEATHRAVAFTARYERTYPAAVACLTSTLPELTVHLRFPAEHWQRIRHTNLLERTFGETRRRTKVIGRLPGERSCLRLVWAVLDRASKGWRGLTYTQPPRGSSKISAATCPPHPPSPSRPPRNMPDGSHAHRFSTTSGTRPRSGVCFATVTTRRCTSVSLSFSLAW
jgi:putative transposase